MKLHRLIAVVAVLAAAFALAIPAGAQTAGPPDGVPGATADGESGNPVAHCLPEQAQDGDDADEGEESEDPEGEAPEEGEESEGTPESETVTPAQQDGTDQGDEASEGQIPEEGESGADESEEGDEASEGQIPEEAEDGSGNDQTEAGEEGDEAGEAERSDVAQCVLNSLPDIVGNAHAASVVSVVQLGIANGYPDGTFQPQQAVTRAQMASFMDRALDLPTPEDISSLLPEDVAADSPHAESIAAVIDAAIALGLGDGSFAPGNPVSRGQMASFLDRAFDLVETGQVPEDALNSVHEDAISAVMGNGIAQGFTDGSFRPQLSVTRGQMASFLDRALNG